MKISTSERLQTDPAGFVEEKIKDFARTGPANRLSFIDDYIIWDEPLVQFADGDDPIFTEYKGIIAPTHFTPREALAKAYNKSPKAIPAGISAISWILPAVEETRKSNRAETRGPSRLWSHTRWYGEEFNEKLRAYMVELLTDMGYLAVAPALPPYFEMYSNEKGLYSNWSERHIAYAAGLGTFSLSDGFITERGIAIRCGSVVTSLALPASPRTTDSPYSNCLFYLGGNCRACIDRCPAGAITKMGHDKNKCQQYLDSRNFSPRVLSKDGYDNDSSTIGCGLCQTNVPCESRNPARQED